MKVKDILIIIIVISVGIVVVSLLNDGVGAEDTNIEDCSSGQQWTCTNVDVGLERGLRVNSLQYKKVGKSFHSVSDYEYSSWLEINRTMHELPHYKYGSSYGEDLIQTSNLSKIYEGGGYTFSTAFNGTVDAHNFSLTQTFRIIGATVYFNDQIAFYTPNPEDEYWVIIHHRSDAHVVDSSNDVYVWHYEQGETWSQVKNEIAIDASHRTVNGYSLKVVDGSNTVHYQPMYSDYNSHWNINLNSGGFTDAAPYFADTGGYPHDTEIDVWFMWRKQITDTVNMGYYLVPTTWPD